jgi:hypothetical protein
VTNNRAMKSTDQHGGKAPRSLYFQMIVLRSPEIPSIGDRVTHSYYGPGTNTQIVTASLSNPDRPVWGLIGIKFKKQIYTLSTLTPHSLEKTDLNQHKVALGGLVVACLPLDPRFAGSNPAEDDAFLRAIKIRSTTSFGG